MEDEGSPPPVTSKPSGRVISWMESILSAVSQTFMGLPFLKLFDYCLYVAEKSAQWSLPSHEINAEESGKLFGKIELIRPLPWILFLPGLIILRIIRGGLNMGAFLIGYPPVEAIAMVKFLQKSRRRLRTFYLKATKASRRKPASPGEKSSTESAASPTNSDGKRKFSEMSSSESESETVLTQLDNCASENSSDDSDFNPATCNEQSSTSSSGNEDEKNISLAELEDISLDCIKFLNDKSISVDSAHSSSLDEKEKSTSAIELEDTQKDAQGPAKSESQEIDNSGTSNAFPRDKTASDEETDGAKEMNETRVDTPGYTSERRAVDLD